MHIGRYMFIFGMATFHYISPDIFISFLCIKGHTRFLNFYGQPEARLNCDLSVYDTSTNQRTRFIKTISIFLSSAPDVHLRTLQNMGVDCMIYKDVVKESWTKSGESSFYTWVVIKHQHDCLHHWKSSRPLLNANVAFLGTPRAGTLPGADFSSYLSISTSVGSIILGLLLVRRHQIKDTDTAMVSV